MNCIDQVVTDTYTAIHGDCVEALKGLPDACIGYSIFSPPFALLSFYTSQNSPRDMGNVRNDAEFFEHFDFLIAELRRVMKPDRNVSKVPLHGYATEQQGARWCDWLEGLPDLMRAIQRHGFIFHSKVVIWKDPPGSHDAHQALGLLPRGIRSSALKFSAKHPGPFAVRAGEAGTRNTHHRGIPGAPVA